MSITELNLDNLNPINTEADEFEWIRTLGTGGFATVELVTNKRTKKQLALKKIRTSLLGNNEVKIQVKNEMEILGKCTESPFVIQYHGSIVTKHSIVFMLEPCLGGDLWSVMQRKGVFNDTSTRFYAGCIIEGLKYLSSLNILYRDLKPENLLLDQSGYVKIADLGFSKILTVNQQTRTAVGTAEYLAPEILCQQGYDHTSSLWSLGILIYELLTGSPPFTADDQNNLFAKICKGFYRFRFPSYMSSGAVEVVMMLCRINPRQRPGLDMVTRYMWLTGMDWDQLRKGTLEPPYLPELEEDVTCEEISRFQGF